MQSMTSRHNSEFWVLLTGEELLILGNINTENEAISTTE
jgi:hypothetical protein